MLKPLGDRIIIEVAKEGEKAVGGIVLASTAKKKPQTGTVVTVSEDRLLEGDEKVPATVKAGDQAVFEKYAGTEVKYGGRECLIVAGEDIMAVIEQIWKTKK